MAALLSGIAQLCCICLFRQYQMLVVVSYILIIPLMTLGAYGYRSAGIFLKRLICGFGAACLLGGTYFALTRGKSREDGCGGILWTVFAVLLCAWGAGVLQNRRKRSANVFEVLLEHGGESVRVSALWDTGNHLTGENGLGIQLVDERVVLRLKLQLPKAGSAHFQSLGEQRGEVSYYQIRRMVIQDQKGKVERKEVLIAPVSTALFRGKEYQMILHAAVFEEGNEI